MKLYSRQPIEVANGEIIEMMPPDFLHSLTTRVLDYALSDFVRGKRVGVVLVETAYLLEADERTDGVKGSRVPDVSFVVREKIDAHVAKYGKQGPLRFVPDLAVEIVSLGDDPEELDDKIADYLRYGVRLVWVIDPHKRQARVITPDNPSGRTLSDADTLTGDPVLPGWSALIADLLDAQPN